jgi:uncharacterized protein (DUF2384 family)
VHLQQKSHALFGNLPVEDYLGLLKGENPKKVVDYLKFSQEEVSSATGIPKKSVRYDDKIPQELIKRLQEIAVICELVAEFFKGDLEKTNLWLNIKNPLLGNISPRDMIRFGRYEKLLKFIQDALEGEAP